MLVYTAKMLRDVVTSIGSVILWFWHAHCLSWIFLVLINRSAFSLGSYKCTCSEILYCTCLSCPGNPYLCTYSVYQLYDTKISLSLISLTTLLSIISPLTYTRSKMINFVCCLLPIIIGTKISKSQDLSIWATCTCKYIESVKIVQNGLWASQIVQFCWPYLPTYAYCTPHDFCSYAHENY